MLTIYLFVCLVGFFCWLFGSNVTNNPVALAMNDIQYSQEALGIRTEGLVKLESISISISNEHDL